MGLFVAGAMTTKTVVGLTAHPERSIFATQRWSIATLAYHRDFPYTGYQLPIAGCSLTPGKRKKEQTGLPLVLRCMDLVKLLIPTTLANTWEKEQKQLGHINPYTREIMAAHMDPDLKPRIISIQPAKLNPENFIHTGNTNLVTALFIRHARNVRTYTFKNVKTGGISTANATPNHPFYVKNKKKFMPLNNITTADTLLTEAGQSVRLICHKGDKRHCSTLYKEGNITTVYNMETYPNHTYFAGRDNHILVHNCSGHQIDEKAKEDEIFQDIFGDTIPRKMAVRFIENPPCKKITEDQWVSLDSAQRYHLYFPNLKKTVSWTTRHDIVGIADYYGTEVDIEKLHMIEQDYDGRFKPPGISDKTRATEINQLITMYSAQQQDYEKENRKLEDILARNPKDKMREQHARKIENNKILIQIARNDIDRNKRLLARINS